MCIQLCELQPLELRKVLTLAGCVKVIDLGAREKSAHPIVLSLDVGKTQILAKKTFILRLWKAETTTNYTISLQKVD